MLSQLESELKEEPSLLARAMRSVPEPLPSGSILVGAGDSYAAALGASYLSPLESLVMDPYELIASPSLARAKTVVLISFSGRTRSNVAAARSVRRAAKERIAMTSNPQSPLAEEADRVFLMPFEYRPRWPGMASFSISLLYAAKLLSVKTGVDFGRASSRGRAISRGLRFSKSGTTFFLGNRALFAVSMYAAAKLYEYFGAASQYQRLEEFSHMELFSVKNGDAVNVFGGSDPLRIGGNLAKSLSGAGYEACLAHTEGENETESVFNAIFATQFAVKRWIEERKTERPYILDAGSKLAISDAMIY